MFATDNDYEEAIRGASIHAYEYRENKKRFFIKLLSFATAAVLLSVGFNYYQKYSLQEAQNLIVSSELQSKSILDNSQLTKEVLEISNEESKDKEPFQNKLEDEYLTALKHSSDALVQNIDKKDEYLVALESMEVDVLDNSQLKSIPTTPKLKSIETTNLNQMNLGDAISNLVDESAVDNSNYTNDLKKEIIAENSSKGRVIVVKKGDTLESISKKFYGNPMRYKEIMASNSNLLNDSSVIYEGQEITLP